MAASTLDLDAAQIPEDYHLKWVDVKNLLKAGLNLSFCTSEDAAQGLISYGGTTDYLSFMGGFSHVVALACPSKAALSEQSEWYSGKYNIDNRVELYVGKYVRRKTKEDWEDLDRVLETFAPGKDEKLAFAEDDKREICNKVEAELVKFFTALSRERVVWIVFIKAFDMISYHPDVYGAFGISGTKTLGPDDLDHTIMVSTVQPADDAKDVPKRLLWGFVHRATAYASTLGY